MNYSQIKIRFNQELDVNNEVAFVIKSYKNTVLDSELSVHYTCLNPRNAIYKFSKALTSTNIIGEQTAKNFANAFKLDYDFFGKVEATNPQPFVISVVGKDLFIKIFHTSEWSFEFLENENFTTHSSVSKTYINSEEFISSNFTPNEITPNFFVSESNSFRFAKRVDFDTVLKNDENTLSDESFVKDDKVRYMDCQLYQTNDKITTQFKTDKSDVKAYLLYDDQELEIKPIIKKSINFNNKYKADANIYNENGKTYIYFKTGNVYNYDTDAIISQHSLNGYLPYFAKIGNKINLFGQWCEIKDVVYIENLYADVIVLDENISFNSTAVVSSIYNSQDYEVYEFVTEMTTLNGKNCRVKIVAYDDYLSELINVENVQENTVEFIYYNKTNTDIDYSTGIRHLLRPSIFNIAALKEDDFENTKSDTKVSLLTSEIYKGKEFIFDACTEKMMNKLVDASSHEKVFIDRVGFTKNSSIDVEGPFDDSNVYQVKSKMLKSGEMYKEIPVVIIPKAIVINGVFSLGENGFYISFSSNFELTSLQLLIYNEYDILLNTETLTGLISPQNSGFAITQNVILKLVDTNGDEIVESNIYQYDYVNQTPTAVISWDGTNNSPITGTLEVVTISVDSVTDVEGDTISQVWQRKLNDSSWIDNALPPDSINEFALTEGVNQFRLKVTDYENNVGYSNILQYTKTEMVVESIFLDTLTHTNCSSYWEVEIIPINIDCYCNIFLNTTNNGDYLNFANENLPYQQITSDTEGIEIIQNESKYLMFGIDGAISGGAPTVVSTTITVEVYTTSDVLVESKSFERNHSTQKC